MKRLVFCIVAVGLIVSFSLSCFAAELKIGYVDTLKVFNDYKKTVDYDTKLEERKNEADKEFEKKREKIEKMRDKLNLMKETEQEEQKEKLTEEIQDFRKEQQAVLIDLRKERSEKMEEILGDIEKVVADYAKKNKFDFIMHDSAVLFGGKSFDITDQILKLVNKQYRK